jgi:hypothetical protein
MSDDAPPLDDYPADLVARVFDALPQVLDDWPWPAEDREDLVPREFILAGLHAMGFSRGASTAVLASLTAQGLFRECLGQPDARFGNRCLGTTRRRWRDYFAARRAAAPPPSQAAAAEAPPGAPPEAELLSARDLASRLGLKPDRVEVVLRRYRDEYPDCYVDTDSGGGGRRRNQPRYLYRTRDVLPHLRRHFRLTDG